MKNKIKNILKSVLHIKERQKISYHRYPLNSMRKRPAFLIIGSQKAGTTSLFHYLSQHSMIEPPSFKESHFFNMNYDRGIQYYKSLFPLKKDTRVTFEATPDYLDHPIAPKLCSELLPNVKLIVLLREPVDRAYSHFNFVQTYNQEEREISFEQGLQLEAVRMEKAYQLITKDRYNSARMFSNYGYRRKGEYVDHIKNWLAFYSKKNMLIVDFERLKKIPNIVLNEIFDYLDLDTINTNQINTSIKYNKKKYNKNINPTTEAKLQAYYAPFNKQLFKLTNYKFDW